VGRVPRGRGLNLVISKGPAVVEMPPLVGRPLQEARRLLEELGITVREVRTTPTADFDPGIVVAQVPEPGTRIRPQDRVVVTVTVRPGEERTPQLHEFLVAMELVSPAAIAYWSAMNHHGMTDQIPQTVFVATNHRVRRPPKEALGMRFKIVTLRPAKFFGLVQDWLDEQPFWITSKEKTIIDGLDLPKYVGGVGEVAKALTRAWDELDEAKLRNYAAKLGNSAATKRLGYLMESLGLGDPETLRKTLKISPGFSPLDPTLPRRGKHNRRWQLLVNVEVTR